MSKELSDRQVRIAIALLGQYIELTRERGFGDNPAFYAWQIEQLLDKAKDSIRAMVEAEHGRQHTEAPLNESRRSRA